MKAKFFIDRQFGQAIFVDVEDGIVTNVSNDSQLQDKMKELYVGKSISFLKKDFEEKMKPSYHCVKSADRTLALQNRDALDTQIRQLELNALRRLGNGGFVDKANEDEITRMEWLLSNFAEANSEIKRIEKELKEIHKFEF